MPTIAATANAGRVGAVTSLLADVFAARAATRPVFVVVDGKAAAAAEFADRLARVLAPAGQTYRLTDDDFGPSEDLGADDAGAHEVGAGKTRTAGAIGSPLRRVGSVTVADGGRWRVAAPPEGWDAVVYLRTAPRPSPGAGHDDRGTEHDADVVIDYHDPNWPVIRRLHRDLADRERWYLPESRAFFAARAASWDTKFGDDMPAYAAAVADAGLTAGQRAADIGCGTGRALPALRAAVGTHGVVVGIDVTPEMLDAARRAGRDRFASLLLADARRLPMATASLDVVFAAGLVNHLPDPREGLAELARVTRTAGTLVIFHPVGRAALADRHGRTLRPDEPLARSELEPNLAAAGWQLTRYDDHPDRFLAVARRQ